MITRLKAELDHVLASPEFREKVTSLGADVLTSDSPEAFAEFIRREHAKWSELVKASGGRVE